jgi:uncharacterized protein YqhQ
LLRLAARAHLLPVLEAGEETLVGGQAVVEGVMMRTPHAYAIAVRKPDGQVVVDSRPLPRLSEQYPVFKWPVLRGIGTLGHSMALGVRALNYSTDIAMQAEAEKQGVVATPGKKAGEIPAWAMAGSLILSLLFFLGAFKFVPLLITNQMQPHWAPLNNLIIFNLVEGCIRMLILVAYMWVISLWGDIRRVFEYHGAEHKVVFNFESGKPLTVENAQRFVTFHPRCGTSFLMVVLIVSVVVYSFFPVTGFLMKLLVRIAALPLIAGLSYEMIRWAARHRGGLLATLTAPGLWLQRITTQPPSDEQTEVAIIALERAMEIEREHGGEMIIA